MNKLELENHLNKELRRNRIICKERDVYKYENLKLKRTIKYILLTSIGIILAIINYHNFGI